MSACISRAACFVGELRRSPRRTPVQSNLDVRVEGHQSVPDLERMPSQVDNALMRF